MGGLAVAAAAAAVEAICQVFRPDREYRLRGGLETRLDGNRLQKYPTPTLLPLICQPFCLMMCLWGGIILQ
uniref:Uncharacterized protein n=1 Tax=Anopheles darlingi TaxID=43151 RepID=A0A2M4DDY7_ANODA